MLMAIPDLFRTLVAFAVVLGVLVFVHELGHYLAARYYHVDATLPFFIPARWCSTMLPA